MIEISQKDFEAKIQDVIDGKTTRVKLLEELRTDRITLNNKIQELSISNPDLYRAFVLKFPYRPREYTHIDYEAIIIDILKRGYTRREVDAVYDGISSRTIQRKIKEIEVGNPELVELYREVSRYRKAQKELPLHLAKQIEDLEEREIFTAGVCDNKIKELSEMKEAYNAEREKGIGVRKASKKVGQSRVSKSIDTLKRIGLERQVMDVGNTSKKEEGER